MKALFVICLLGVALTFTAAYPRKPYKIVKGQRSKDTPTSDSGTLTTSGGGGDVAAVLVSRVESTTAVPVSPAPVEPEVITEKSKLGEKPFGEPTPLPHASNPPLFPPKPEELPSISPVTETSIDAASAPASTFPPSPITLPDSGPIKVSNVTSSEEDDSSSEEDADEGDEEARLLISPKKSKSVKMGVSSDSKGRAGPPKNPPLKYDMIINGYVTDDGKVLIPFNTYQKFFQYAQDDNESPPRLPPVYAITRQEGSQESGTSVLASEENEDKHFEEGVQLPVRLSQTNDIYSEKSKPLSESETDSSETPQGIRGSSEEVEKEAPGDSEEKEKHVESEEKETPSVEFQEKPATSTKIRPIDDTRTPVFRPPLQALPARLPTHEDDEEEAGRYLAQFGFLPQFDYDDDESIHHGISQKHAHFDY